MNKIENNGSSSVLFSGYLQLNNSEIDSSLSSQKVFVSIQKNSSSNSLKREYPLVYELCIYSEDPTKVPALRLKPIIASEIHPNSMKLIENSSQFKNPKSFSITAVSLDIMKEMYFEFTCSTNSIKSQWMKRLHEAIHLNTGVAPIKIGQEAPLSSKPSPHSDNRRAPREELTEKSKKQSSIGNLSLKYGSNVVSTPQPSSSLLRRSGTTPKSSNSNPTLTPFDDQKNISWIPGNYGNNKYSSRAVSSPTNRSRTRNPSPRGNGTDNDSSVDPNTRRSSGAHPKSDRDHPFSEAVHAEDRRGRAEKGAEFNTYLNTIDKLRKLSKFHDEEDQEDDDNVPDRRDRAARGVKDLQRLPSEERRDSDPPTDRRRSSGMTRSPYDDPSEYKKNRYLKDHSRNGMKQNRPEDRSGASAMNEDLKKSERKYLEPKKTRHSQSPPRLRSSRRDYPEETGRKTRKWNPSISAERHPGVALSNSGDHRNNFTDEGDRHSNSKYKDGSTRRLRPQFESEDSQEDGRQSYIDQRGHSNRNAAEAVHYGRERSSIGSKTEQRSYRRGSDLSESENDVEDVEDSQEEVVPKKMRKSAVKRVEYSENDEYYSDDRPSGGDGSGSRRSAQRLFHGTSHGKEDRISRKPKERQSTTDKSSKGSRTSQMMAFSDKSTMRKPAADGTTRPAKSRKALDMEGQRPVYKNGMKPFDGEAKPSHNGYASADSNGSQNLKRRPDGVWSRRSGSNYSKSETDHGRMPRPGYSVEEEDLRYTDHDASHPSLRSPGNDVLQWSRKNAKDKLIASKRGSGSPISPLYRVSSTLKLKYRSFGSSVEKDNFESHTEDEWVNSRDSSPLPVKQPPTTAEKQAAEDKLGRGSYSSSKGVGNMSPIIEDMGKETAQRRREDMLRLSAHSSLKKKLFDQTDYPTQEKVSDTRRTPNETVPKMRETLSNEKFSNSGTSKQLNGPREVAFEKSMTHSEVDRWRTTPSKLADDSIVKSKLHSNLSGGELNPMPIAATSSLTSDLTSGLTSGLASGLHINSQTMDMNRRKLEAMSVTDVAEWKRLTEWLRSIGYSEYELLFRQHGITKLSLVELLQERDLKLIGIGERDLSIIATRIAEFSRRTRSFSEQALGSASNDMASLNAFVASSSGTKATPLTPSHGSPLHPSASQLTRSNGMMKNSHLLLPNEATSSGQKEIHHLDAAAVHSSEHHFFDSKNLFRKILNNKQQIRTELLKAFDGGDSDRFFHAWKQAALLFMNEDAIHAHSSRPSLYQARQAMEFHLHLHFAVYPVTHDWDKARVRREKDRLKNYLESILISSESGLEDCVPQPPFRMPITADQLKGSLHDTPPDGMSKFSDEEDNEKKKDRLSSSPTRSPSSRNPLGSPTLSSAFTRSREFATYAGMVMVPQPQQNIAFASLFHPEWMRALRDRLCQFLDLIDLPAAATGSETHVATPSPKTTVQPQSSPREMLAQPSVALPVENSTIKVQKKVKRRKSYRGTVAATSIQTLKTDAIPEANEMALPPRLNPVFEVEETLKGNDALSTPMVNGMEAAVPLEMVAAPLDEKVDNGAVDEMMAEKEAGGDADEVGNSNGVHAVSEVVPVDDVQKEREVQKEVEVVLDEEADEAAVVAVVEEEQLVRDGDDEDTSISQLTDSTEANDPQDGPMGSEMEHVVVKVENLNVGGMPRGPLPTDFEMNKKPSVSQQMYLASRSSSPSNDLKQRTVPVNLHHVSSNPPHLANGFTTTHPTSPVSLSVSRKTAMQVQVDQYNKMILKNGKSVQPPPPPARDVDPVTDQERPGDDLIPPKSSKSSTVQISFDNHETKGGSNAKRRMNLTPGTITPSTAPGMKLKTNSQTPQPSTATSGTSSMMQSQVDMYNKLLRKQQSNHFVVTSAANPLTDGHGRGLNGYDGMDRRGGGLMANGTEKGPDSPSDQAIPT